jgi:succinoglycan biosynthesis protein ExoM
VNTHASPSPTAPERQGLRRLTIAVLTFRRPRDLEEVLPLLIQQGERAVSPHLSAEVLVIDNDPAAGARAEVEDAATLSTKITVRYEHEPEPGISAARNRALDSSGTSNLLVFIDDDERPSDSWLAELLKTFELHRPTAVVGPVVSEFNVPLSDWVAAGGFFDRRRLVTGASVEVAATNNLLLDLDAVRGLDLHFDPAFGITGGDDTMFTRQLVARGGRIIWSAEAVVTDVVPAERITRRWVVMRALSSGNSWSLVALKLSPNRPRRAVERAKLTAKGLVRLVGGTGRAAVGSLLRDQPAQARGVRTSARGAGMLLGAYGYSYREYRRKDG